MIFEVKIQKAFFRLMLEKRGRAERKAKNKDVLCLRIIIILPLSSSPSGLQSLREKTAMVMIA